MKEKLINLFSKIKDKNFLLTISFFMLLQPLIYFFIKYLQHNYHYINTTIDNLIPFCPYFIYIYNLFYFFTFFSFYYLFIHDKKKYYLSVIASISGTIICYIIYLIYPTIMIRPEINYSLLDSFTSLVLKVTYFFDNPAINCFPSIHCLYCFQIIISLILIKNIKTKNKIIISILALLIIISTFLVKQHYVYDIIGALVICIITNLIVFLTFKKSYLKNR